VDRKQSIQLKKIYIGIVTRTTLELYNNTDIDGIFSLKNLPGGAVVAGDVGGGSITRKNCTILLEGNFKVSRRSVTLVSQTLMGRNGFVITWGTMKA